VDDPDAALMAWLDHEEAMFRRLERRIVSTRIEKGFIMDEGVDVDGFLSFSLSVQNRRKSRMGYSLEHHLEAIFRQLGINHTRKNMTERGHRPDFLFPGHAEYRDPAFPAEKLFMLASKSSSKERWRQVLPEADRIEAKHLLTLEPGISVAQTDQMQAHRLQLVVPKSIQASYSGGQQSWLWSLRQFTGHLTGMQR
jgi:EcoRII C terminal